MSHSSSASESDSNISEDVMRSVPLALEAMKKRLSSAVSQGKPPNGRLFEKIQQTFTNNSGQTVIQTQQKSVKKKKKKKQNKPMSTDFFIDRASGSSDRTKDNKQDEKTVETFDLSNMNVSEGDNVISENMKNKKKKKKKKKKKQQMDGLSSELSCRVSTEDVYINVDPENNPGGQRLLKENQQRHKEPEIMKKSVIADDFERKESVPTATSHRQKKRERKFEREKTKGDKWFHMPAVELTDEQKTDLQVLKMRKALDPKRFYKANDTAAEPKFVQFGKVVESAADFYDSRIPKKQRKATIVEELLADTEFRKYNKRKYEEIQDARRMGKGPYQHMKRMKKRKT